jgi:hypothetical protein
MLDTNYPTLRGADVLTGIPGGKRLIQTSDAELIRASALGNQVKRASMLPALTFRWP